MSSFLFGVFAIFFYCWCYCSSISDQRISSIALNSTGDWVALGCVGLGQLLVWEWQSETYVMKQQGHFNNITCFAYSPDGQYIVTGGEDGKVSGPFGWPLASSCLRCPLWQILRLWSSLVRVRCCVVQKTGVISEKPSAFVCRSFCQTLVTV